MKSFQKLVLLLLIAVGSISVCACAQNNPHVVVETNLGDIVIELFPDQAPVTVDNFLGYTNSGFYDGLVFHRVMYEFMIQGGGYYVSQGFIYPQTTGAQIINESDNGLSNLRGTIAMARSKESDSASSQFFINHVDNLFLDRQNASDGFGYCVFGQVVSGMDVVDAIAAAKIIYVSGMFTHFPYPLVEIERAYVQPCDLADCSDISGDGGVDLEDFAMFITHWLDNDCNSANSFCNQADLNYSGTCDFKDFAIFSANWYRSDE